jgi:hypothetical protein
MPNGDVRFQRLLDDNQGCLERLARQYTDRPTSRIDATFHELPA